jgi:hypothetical protein
VQAPLFTVGDPVNLIDVIDGNECEVPRFLPPAFVASIKPDVCEDQEGDKACYDGAPKQIISPNENGFVFLSGHLCSNWLALNIVRKAKS